LRDDRSVLAFTFAGEGLAGITVGNRSEELDHISGNWWVDDFGALNVAGPEGKPAFRLLKMNSMGDRYEVNRAGWLEVYVRVKSDS
jgi:hypothetical protein